MKPATRYVLVDDVHIAVQEIGSGPALVYIPQWFSNVEALWDVPELAHWVTNMARYRRVVLFDKRGTGLSDPAIVTGTPSLEQFGRDLEGVLDALGIVRTALVAGDSAGLLALWFAATKPDRVEALVLCNAFARLLPSGTDTQDPPPAFLQRSVANARRMWVEADVSEMAPSMAGDSVGISRLVRFLRQSASPGTAMATRHLLAGLDVRQLLPTVQAPALVMHRADNTFADVEHARVVAAGLPQARLVEVPGADHLFYLGDPTRPLSEIEQFLTGRVSATSGDRLLATLLFTDIVGSTTRVVAVGDADWRDVLDRLDQQSMQIVQAAGAEIVTRTGDGVLARFDGPGQAAGVATLLHQAAAALGLQLRIGIHTGEVQRRGADLAGVSVHVTKRIQEAADPGATWVSRTVVDLVAGSGLHFVSRGSVALKGLQEPWQLFALATS
jgi:pimeloyl-ACP methyl ester carboxylesterase